MFHFRIMFLFITSCLVSCGLLLLGRGNLHTLSGSAIPETKSSNQTDPFFTKIYFSKSDAEKILGEKAILSDSSATVKKDTLEIKKTYTAGAVDKKTGKRGVVYFMIEQYAQESAAKQAYHFFKVANEKDARLETKHDMGDEAYLQHSGTKMYFVLVRKGAIMFRIKAKKGAGHSTPNECTLTAKKIADSL